jgi:hypothetical protein
VEDGGQHLEDGLLLPTADAQMAQRGLFCCVWGEVELEGALEMLGNDSQRRDHLRMHTTSFSKAPASSIPEMLTQRPWLRYLKWSADPSPHLSARSRKEMVRLDSQAHVCLQREESWPVRQGFRRTPMGFIEASAQLVEHMVVSLRVALRADARFLQKICSHVEGHTLGVMFQVADKKGAHS